ncbi:MAG: deoxyribose-phosphate aldolase [Planctomycetota bacterium]|nr:deoxyribose-phosphate aldolase [Planctomycetota bacterium]
MTNLASKIDHSLLAAHATPQEIRKLVEQALKHRFASVCTNPIFTAAVTAALRADSAAEAASLPRVLNCAVVGFPLGANKATLKAIEATSAAKDGADEIDVVAHIPHLLAADFNAAKEELLEVARAARSARPRVVIKVILETAALLKDVAPAVGEARIEAGCRAAREAGCDFVKTSTGFHPAGGASVEAVRLLKKHSGGMYVKASGGIRTREDALRMLDAGADRLGCSASVEIIAGG